MIPPLEDGVLPDGIHDRTADEVEAVFGRFQASDRRVRLTERLRAYLAVAAGSGIVVAVVIDGSYVTAKDEPEDIDLIVVRRADVDVTYLQPFEYNAISKSEIRRAYKFDVFSVIDGTDDLAERIEFFSRINPNKPSPSALRTTKGLLRICYAPTA